MIDWRLADTAMTERRIAAYFPHHLNARGTGSYTCLSLCENMRGNGLELDLHVPASDPEAADWIFAPSPFVRRSLIAAGIPAGKVLSTSYGWSPQRSGAPRRERAAKASVFLFVGTVCIRKGAHLLAEAWAQAAVPGQLEFCGQLLPEIERVSRTHLARPDVRLRGQVTTISSAYAAADVFVFPTLEEGSPLVVMEAMAQGLPVLTSPMGAGEILRD